MEPRRDWMSKAEKYNAKETQRRYLGGVFKGLRWEPVTEELTLPMSPGMAIKAVIRQCRIPKVSHVAWNGVAYNRYGVYGIEGHYSNGRVRVYVLDRGAELHVVAADVWEAVPA